MPGCHVCYYESLKRSYYCPYSSWQWQCRMARALPAEIICARVAWIRKASERLHGADGVTLSPGKFV
ncbi:uncharacterized protein MYCFIDRAFT_182617 [Pseudocercospora fijiensis CIRAD86]|uniref:Uncharacterized protein n=1 Tax=Pseudocercospora fijiensis (strain CIRAD86) TaxID=383855 RepID=M3B024_PSEFD|nr:uncharacterized protein MYCFIDRAFT_182617 [Pseudocercospora fijiensis CIRAD86]EME82748.1 hypothetical protein MYCFIDRAFT_182617 [Pseudocercospora fijiensis CIRAD86]